jgi:hypothetical protein
MRPYRFNNHSRNGSVNARSDRWRPAIASNGRLVAGSGVLNLVSLLGGPVPPDSPSGCEIFSR